MQHDFSPDVRGISNCRMVEYLWKIIMYY